MLRGDLQNILALACAVAIAAVSARSSGAQSLEDRLDEDRFLQGLTEFRVPEVLEHYIRLTEGNDPVQRALYEIAADRMSFADPAATPGERLGLIDNVLAARTAMIEAHPFDPRHAVWLADQAEDLFFALYPIEATNLAAEFGLPSPQQRERAERVAGEMFDLASQAELEITETILNIESEPDYADDITLQLKRRRLARDERDRRIPFLLGVGAYLDGLFNAADASAARSRFNMAVDLLEPLIPELEGALRVRARLYLGMAVAQLGRYDEAEELFRAIASDASAAPVDAFAARMGGVINRAVRNGPESALDGLDSIEERYADADGVFFRLLIADRRFLLRREIAREGDAVDRDRAMLHAFAAYTDLLEADMGIPEASVRAMVFARLANAAEADVPLDQLPAIVTVARAENLARQDATRPEAIALFTQSLQRDDLDDVTKGAALFGLARTHHAQHDWLAAAERFLQVAREHPTDPNAERAIEIAAALLVDLRAKAPETAEVERQLETTFDVMFSSYPNLASIDRWRYEYALLHFDRGEQAQARQALQQIPPGADVWPDSRFLLARVMRAEAMHAPDDARRDAGVQALLDGLPALREPLERALTAAVNARETQRAGVLRYYLAFLRVFEAESHLELGSPTSAIDALRGMVDDPQLDRTVLGEVLAVRIKALQAAGRPGEAREDFATIMARFPDQADAVVPAMLESLRGDVTSRLNRGDEQGAQRIARDDLVPFVELVADWLKASDLTPDERIPLELEIADAYRLAGDFDRALPVYERIVVLEPNALQPLLGRAECLFGLARFAEAMPIFKRLAASRRSVMDDTFWLSELRQLQILDRSPNVTERQRAQVLPQIERLRAMDDTLGGDRYRPRFNELAVKYRGLGG